MPWIVSVSALGISSSRECSCSSRKCTCVASGEVEVAATVLLKSTGGHSALAAALRAASFDCVACNEISCRYRLCAAVAPSRSSGQQCTDCVMTIFLTTQTPSAILFSFTNNPNTTTTCTPSRGRYLRRGRYTTPSSVPPDDRERGSTAASICTAPSLPPTRTWL